MKHYTADELLAYVDGNDSVVDLLEVYRHLQQCAGCARRLREVKEDYLTIADGETWRDVSVSELDRQRIAEFSAVSRAVATNIALADHVFSSLEAHPRSTWLEHLAMTAGGSTPEMIRRLVQAARAEEESSPLDSLALLDVAEALASLVEADARKESALVELWRARATALLMTGAYPAALKALDEAEAHIAADAAGEYERAFPIWTRAIVLFELGRYPESLVLVGRARQIWASYGDEGREAHTEILRAGILYEQGDIPGAEAIWTSLVERLRKLGDRMSLARVYANLACCRLQEHDFSSVQSLGAQATAIYEEFGLETEKIRMRWAFGRARVRGGDVAGGIEELARVAADFQALGMPVDAASVSLEIIEARLAAGEYDEAARVAREIAAVFARAEAKLEVAKALAYLREATERHEATAELLRAVRHVLDHPLQLFSPPDA
jgi:tetratricopeptide (TPR) repeat protein